MPRTTVDTTISITPEQRDWIVDITGETGMSRSEVHRWALDTIRSLNLKPIIIRSTATTAPTSEGKA